MIKLILINFLFILFTNLGFAQDYLKLHFIDIGEGDAILIQNKDSNVLIDTGNLLSGYKLIDYLVKNRATKIRYLIISHPDPDHISGVFFILPKLEVEQIYDNGQTLNEDDDIQRWYKILVRLNKNYQRLKKGDRLKLKDVDLDVLWPATVESGSYNENSLVIELSYNHNFSCLFMGDLNNAAEDNLLKDKINLKADILKVGHHGYMDATPEELLDTVSPKVAIISVGLNNKIGAPSCVTLELLTKKNIKIYRTDEDGNIIISVNKKGNYSIKTEKENM